MTKARRLQHFWAVDRRSTLGLLVGVSFSTPPFLSDCIGRRHFPRPPCERRGRPAAGRRGCRRGRGAFGQAGARRVYCVRFAGRPCPWRGPFMRTSCTDVRKTLFAQMRTTTFAEERTTSCSHLREKTSCAHMRTKRCAHQRTTYGVRTFTQHTLCATVHHTLCESCQHHQRSLGSIPHPDNIFKLQNTVTSITVRAKPMRGRRPNLMMGGKHFAKGSREQIGLPMCAFGSWDQSRGSKSVCQIRRHMLK